jgi:hypothetical protein
MVSDMINMNTIESLNALKHYGIHTARTKIVDSPEDAIAFAERRNAPDPRFMPIVLFGSASGIASSALSTEDAIRRAYEYLAQGAAPPKIVAQEVTEAGTQIAISGSTDADEKKTLALQGAERMMPLDTAGAEWLASNYQRHHHHGKSEKARHMLEHLLLSASEFFEESGVSAFQMTVRLHENSYTVLGASMTAPRALHLKERLARHAHDRKGADYHPAGRE